MVLGLFKDNTAREETDGPEPIPQRTISKSENEDFGTHLVVNEGIATPDMEAWYIDIDEDTGEASEISQREIMMQVARRDKNARTAFFRQNEEDRKKALQQEDLPDWTIPAANTLHANMADDFQLQFEHMKNNLFRAVRSDENGLKQVWVIEARRNGDLVLLSKLEDADRFTGEDYNWDVRSKGEATLSPPEFKESSDEDLDEEMITADVEEFTREKTGEDDVEDAVVKEFLKGAYREYGLSDEVTYTVEYEDGFFRFNINDGEVYVYNFIDHGKIQDFFGIPEWSIHILWEEQTRDRIPFPDDTGDE